MSGASNSLGGLAPTGIGCPDPLNRGEPISGEEADKLPHGSRVRRAGTAEAEWERVGSHWERAGSSPEGPWGEGWFQSLRPASGIPDVLFDVTRVGLGAHPFVPAATITLVFRSVERRAVWMSAHGLSGGLSEQAITLVEEGNG